MSLEDTTASPAVEPDVTAAPASAEVADTSQQDANPAQSSSADTTDAKQEEAPKDLGDVVKRVVEKTEAFKEDSSTPEAKTEQSETEATAEEADDPDAEVPFHKHPRWQEMKAERDTLRTQVDSFKTDAEAYRGMTGFMQASNLSGEEVAQGFDIMAAMKRATLGDLSTAQQMYDWASQVRDSYGAMLGHSLPQDLQQRIESGEISEDAAREFSQARAKATNLETVRTRESEQAEQARQQAQVRQLQTSVTTSVADWEAGIKRADPDYATHKAGLVEDRVRAIIMEQGAVPRSPEEAVELAKRAYADVNERLKPLTPKPRAVAPPPIGMSARVSTEPKSFADALRNAVNR